MKRAVSQQRLDARLVEVAGKAGSAGPYILGMAVPVAKVTEAIIVIAGGQSRGLGCPRGQPVVMPSAILGLDLDGAGHPRPPVDVHADENATRLVG